MIMKKNGWVTVASGLIALSLCLAVPVSRAETPSLFSPAIEGQTGVLRAVSAYTPKDGVFSFGASFNYWDSEYFRGNRSEFLEPGLTQKRFLGNYQLTVSATQWMELFLATKTVSTQGSQKLAAGNYLTQSIGDLTTGFKIGYDPDAALSVGFDFYTRLYADVERVGYKWDASGYGGKFLFTFDWNRLKGNSVPLRWHLNMGFQKNYSMKLVDHIGTEKRSPSAYYALGMEQDDALLLATALEIPQRYLSFFIEYSTEQYVNTTKSRGWRQYNQSPQRITPGFRITPVGGLAIDLACDLGMGLFGAEENYPLYPGLQTMYGNPRPQNSFNEEVAPDWALMAGLSYTFAPAPPPVIVAAPPNKGTISGRIYDQENSQPLEGAIISFPGTNLTRLYSGSAGEYATCEFLPQTVSLKVEKEGYQETSEPVTVQAGMMSTMDFGLKRLIKIGTISGKVLDKKTSQPLAAVISFDDPKNANLASDPATGEYTGQVTPGSYRIKASVNGYKSEIKLARIEDKRTTIMDYLLEPEEKAPETGTILGTALSKENKPLAAVISFGDPRILNLASDPNTGQYKGPLAPGTYQVTANAQNFKPQAQVAQIEKGLPTLVNFILEPAVEAVVEGAFAGRVVDPDKQPLPAVISFEGADIQNVVASPATGEFYVKIKPGSYSVRAAAQGFKSELKVVQIAAGKKTIAEFVLEPLTKAKLTEKKIEINETIHFETGKAIILPESFGLLDEVSDILRSNPTLSILIEGHTDSIGSDTSNLILSQNRANAVMQYLTQHGVGSDKLKATGYGKSRPIADNSTANGRAKNRRVEFTIIRK